MAPVNEAADAAAKSVTDYSVITYLWVLALSLWGGAVSFVQKVRAGAARPFNVIEFVGEFVVSGFVGILTFWLCEFAGFSQLMTAPLVGISAHMGTRALFQLEQLVAKKILPP